MDSSGCGGDDLNWLLGQYDQLKRRLEQLTPGSDEHNAVKAVLQQIRPRIWKLENGREDSDSARHREPDDLSHGEIAQLMAVPRDRLKRRKPFAWQRSPYPDPEDRGR
jgi:hypothetical protein